MTDKITLNLDRAGRAGYQISINLVDENGHGHGYRILGPKYLGDSEQIRVVTLDERDASEIRQYLDHVDGGDKVAEQRGYDRAVALLRAEADRKSAEGNTTLWSVYVTGADLLDADCAAPAVLGNGERA